MKKFIYILIAIFTFSAGFGLFKLLPLFTPVSLVQVSQDAELYRFNDVYIKAYLEVTSTEFCCSVIGLQGNSMEGAGFDLTDELQKDADLKKLIEELSKKNEQVNNKSIYKGEFVAEVVIVGRIQKAKACFGPPFFIEAKEVKQVAPTRFISKEEFQKYKPVNHE